MGVIPIIIYRDRKSDKEIQEEIERDRKWRELMEREEARKREEEERERREKLMAKWKEEKAIRKELYESEQRNPWEFRILPGGWNIFGQCYATFLPWDGTEEEYENLTENK